MPVDKLPPHSIEAEQAVLGGLMLDNQAFEKLSGIVTENDFYRADHRLIFRALASLSGNNQPCDVVTLSEWLQSQKLLEDAGGRVYLSTLAQDVPSAANIKAYAQIVREHSVIRQLIGVGTEICDLGFSTEGRDVTSLLSEAEAKVFAIADEGQRGKSGFVPISQLLGKVLEHVEEMFESDSPITGHATGLADFDEMTAGLQRGDLVIVAGRPSMGKTSFAMNIVEHVCVQDKKPTAVFSMEMPGEQLAMRMIASLGRLDQKRLRTGDLQDDDWRRITSTMTLLKDAPLYIDDTPALGPADLISRCRRIKREAGSLELVVVDYLQLMQVTGTTENRTNEISAISRGLKQLAKELDCPVMALSQLNRSLEQRPNKRPIMSDLRESGSIEQDADVITFIYRDEVYNKESAEKGIAEIIIGKQRNGPIGTCKTAFLGKYTRFENLAKDHYDYSQEAM
ncbi:MAG: replicative DNA helicase [Salinisphaeraceae bacterium]|nr:replicative DNA helicase [Salinisphaeraceae bacterium]